MDAAVKKSNHGANVRRWREWRSMNQDVLAGEIGFNPIDKILELCEEKNALYERMLKEKESVIQLLREMRKEKE